MAIIKHNSPDVQLQAVKQPLPDICGLWPDSHKQAHPMPIDPFTVTHRKTIRIYRAD